ncbi:hypothetical protein EYF80_028569 [Liparis tanakae]|uniref:Uncharacterized protein n=1 Tax=Liparis tanakae TaxID=230148 RepID=A0A4Z2H8J7_9TELE|nr:hypothetical protein EYF80_028569 [Liparis tanakae]
MNPSQWLRCSIRPRLTPQADTETSFDGKVKQEKLGRQLLWLQHLVARRDTLRGLAQDDNLGIAPSSEQIQPKGSELSSGRTAVSAHQVRGSRLLGCVPIPGIQTAGLNTNIILLYPSEETGLNTNAKETVRQQCKALFYLQWKLFSM